MFASVATLVMYLGPAWDEFTSRFISDLRPRLEALGIEEDNVLGMMRLWGLALAAILFIGGVVLGKIILAIGVFLFVVSLPRLILDSMIERRKIKLRDDLVTASVGLANTTRAGLTLAQGFENIAEIFPSRWGLSFEESYEVLRVVNH